MIAFLVLLQSAPGMPGNQLKQTTTKMIINVQHLCDIQKVREGKKEKKGRRGVGGKEQAASP